MDTALISDLPAELPESAVVVPQGLAFAARSSPRSATWLDQSTDHRQNADNLSRAASGGIPDNRAGAQIGGTARACHRGVDHALHSVWGLDV